MTSGAIDAIRAADHFTASVFLGRGQYRVEKAATVFDAVRAARTLETEPGAYTRRALIYAIAQYGHTTLLTAALIEKLRILANQSKQRTGARAHKSGRWISTFDVACLPCIGNWNQRFRTSNGVTHADFAVVSGSYLRLTPRRREQENPSRAEVFGIRF
ncbi:MULTISPECIES: hypothetical protein [unclassified Bradyrhizobium]|uniref:hypothetical protein n=1 Tax=unclassified Bradyrhizobium TaxID=2631580 RepID=UPI002FF0C6D6